jgi:mRNA interferase MazF
MPSPKPDEVWLVRFPFTDLTSSKVRPALIVATHKQDIIILGIFSKIPSGTLPETWILIGDDHPEFSQAGLSKTSLIKTEKIATVHQSVFQRHLGALPSDLLQQTQEALKKALNL